MRGAGDGSGKSPVVAPVVVVVIEGAWRRRSSSIFQWLSTVLRVLPQGLKPRRQKQFRATTQPLLLPPQAVPACDRQQTSVLASRPSPFSVVRAEFERNRYDDDDDEWAATEGTRPPARPRSPSATGPPIATCTHDDDDTGCDGHSAPAPVSRAPPMAMVTATVVVPYRVHPRRQRRQRHELLRRSPATCTPYDDDEGDTESPTPLQLPRTVRPYDDNSYGGSDGGKGYNNAAATARDCAHPCDATPLPLPQTPTRFDDDNSSNSDVEYLDSTVDIHIEKRREAIYGNRDGSVVENQEASSTCRRFEIKTTLAVVHGSRAMDAARLCLSPCLSAAVLGAGCTYDDELHVWVTIWVRKAGSAKGSASANVKRPT
ncbi:hypothetical protein EDB83DRAFT_2327847 [Lactarius deliciosus]|nr:hypothetical protein EDB83DRAFT_2327847 [Lactarius deliciosus]